MSGEKAWLYDLLKTHVTEVLVCNPRKIPLHKQGDKSDKIGASIKTTSLSVNGCYIEMMFTQKPGTKVKLTLRLDGAEISSDGIVVSRHLKVGNGIGSWVWLRRTVSDSDAQSPKLGHFSVTVITDSLRYTRHSLRVSRGVSDGR